MTARREDWPSTEDKLEALHYQLIEAVADLASSEAWMTMLRVAARFRDYSGGGAVMFEHREWERYRSRPVKPSRAAR